MTKEEIERKILKKVKKLETLKKFKKSADDKIVADLKANGVLLEDLGLNDGLEISEDLIKNFMEKPVDFFINNAGELNIKVDGEEIILDSKVKIKVKIAENESTLTAGFPEMPWDINCGGFKRKHKEVSVAYKVIILNYVLNNEYKEDINSILETYDFESLRSKEANDNAFFNLLKIIEQNAVSVTKFILSCCSIFFNNKLFTKN